MKISVSCVSSGTKCIPTGITRCFRGPERQRVPGVHQLYTLFFSSCLDLFKARIREITRRAKGVSIETTIAELAPYLRGWRSYFGFCETQIGRATWRGRG